MRTTRHPTSILFLTTLLGPLTACGSGSTDNSSGGGTVSITVGPTAATVPQGGTTVVTGTVVRSGGFAGDVAVTVLNPPAGVTGALLGPIAPGSTTGTVTLAVASSAAVGTFPLVVQASGTGVTTATAQFTLTVTAAGPTGNFTIAATPATLAVVQGATGTTGIKATRTNGLASTISYSSTGAPAGLAIAFASTSTADSTAVTATASSTVVAGTYSIVVTGTAGSLTQQATLSVTVIGTARVDFSACAAAARPIWVAYQDGTGPFTRITGTGDAYTVPAFTAGKGAVAFVTQANAQAGQLYTTTVKYIAQSDIANVVPCTAPVVGKTINGSATGLGSEFAEIGLGGVGPAIVSTASPTFQLTNVPTGPQDLLAYLAAFTGPSSNDHIIIRRDQNIADGGTAAVLDFNGPEFFAPVSAIATITGGGSAQYIPTQRYLVGAACVSDSFTFNNASFPSPLTIYGVPTAKQRTTDFHNLVIQQINSVNDQRTVTTSFHTIADRTIAIGAGLGPFTVTTLSGTYLRLQAAFNLAADYQSAGLNFATGGSNTQIFNVTQSPSYIGGAAAVTITAPDLSAVSGFQTVWGPSTTLPHSYNVAAGSIPPVTLCAEGATTRTAQASLGIPAIRQP